MADFKKLSWMQNRLKPTPRITYENIDPASGWIGADPESRVHQLLIDLPGFKKGDIKFQDDGSSTITVSGGKRVGENKRVQFEKKFKVPEDSDIKRLTTKFEGDTFEVSIPKVPKKKTEEPEISNGAFIRQLGVKKREESDSRKEVKDEKNGASSSELREDIKEESKSSKEVKSENQESKGQGGASSSELKEDKREESKEPNVKEEPDIKNGALSSDITEQKKEESDIKNGALSSDVSEQEEESESSKETKEKNEKPDIKNGALNSDVTEQKKEESDIKNGALSSDISEQKKEESESSKEAKETKENPGDEFKRSMEVKENKEESEIENGALNSSVSEERKEESESSKVTKENEEEPEMKNGALKDEIREEKREEPESSKGTKETEEPEIQNRASSSELTREEKREESENSKEESAKKSDEPVKPVKEQKESPVIQESHHDKGKENSRTWEKSVMEKIIDKRGILLASIISFTLGILVSQKFHKPPAK